MRSEERNEEYDRELLVCGTLICAVLTLVVSFFETTQPSTAKTIAQAPARVEQLTPVRVVGTPLVLNANPSVRLASD
jgi:hypothetical protein